ncbi:class C sortase, partial [Clostridium perfringens]
LGVNSHRLLVRGHRVDDSLSNNTNKNINTDKIPNLDKKEHFRFGTVKTVIVTTIIVLLFLFVFLFILKKRKNNKSN